MSRDVMISAGIDGLAASGGGAVAQRLLANGMNVDCLRPWVEVRKDPTGRPLVNQYGEVEVAGYFVNDGDGRVRPVANATLRKEEWLQFDAAAIEVQRQSLVGVADLNARGLVYNLANGLGTTVLEYQTVSDVEGAEMSMTGRSRSRGDRLEWTSAYLPLPIIHAGFDVDIRQLNASRKLGNPLDTTMVQVKSRKIADFLEDLLFNGISGNFPWGGGNIYGYRTHPNRVQYSLSASWTASGVTAVDIIEDVLGMIQELRDLYFRGPYMLYVPTNYSTVLDEDYHSGTTGWHSGLTIRQRIEQIDGIIGVRTADALASSNVILVQMTPDVVRMVNGLPLRTVEWDSEGGMVTHYKLMTIQVPQIRSDANGSCGVVHAS